MTALTTAPTTALTTGTAAAADARVESTGGRRRVRAAAVGGAALATSALFLVGRTAGTDFTITDPGAAAVPHTFVLPEIAMITVLFGLLGWATLALLERYTSRARRIWTWLAGAVVALSLVPIGIERATTDTRIMLALIHIAVGAALVPMVRTSPRR